MTLTLPDIPTKEDDIRLELACALYAARKLARGIAAKLAGMEADVFERELQQRGISNGCHCHAIWPMKSRRCRDSDQVAPLRCNGTRQQRFAQLCGMGMI